MSFRRKKTRPSRRNTIKEKKSEGAKYQSADAAMKIDAIRRGGVRGRAAVWAPLSPAWGSSRSVSFQNRISLVKRPKAF